MSYRRRQPLPLMPRLLLATAKMTPGEVVHFLGDSVFSYDLPHRGSIKVIRFICTFSLSLSLSRSTPLSIYLLSLPGPAMQNVSVLSNFLSRRRTAVNFGILPSSFIRSRAVPVWTSSDIGPGTEVMVMIAMVTRRRWRLPQTSLTERDQDGS